MVYNIRKLLQYDVLLLVCVFILCENSILSMEEYKMANLNNLFGNFNSEITLSKNKRESLKTSRDALRADVKDWFSDNDKIQPSFHGQGSYSMKTLINPINGKDYDIDDGIYINGYEDSEMDEWPATSTVHSWIKKAVEDRTIADAIDKATCVRISYAKGYHVDLPAYITKDGVAYLAHKGKGWLVSDPKAFTDWFVGKVKNNLIYGEQLRSVVKYLKAWKDYTGNPLKGIELTVLATKSFCKYEGRDDKSLRETVNNIINEIEYNFHCYKPVAPYEDLFENTTETRKSNIITGLKALKDNLDNAMEETDEKKASEILRDKAFGTRFPLGKETKKSNYTASNAPGVLKSDGRSA